MRSDTTKQLAFESGARIHGSMKARSRPWHMTPRPQEATGRAALFQRAVARDAETCRMDQEKVEQETPASFRHYGTSPGKPQVSGRGARWFYQKCRRAKAWPDPFFK